MFRLADVSRHLLESSFKLKRLLLERKKLRYLVPAGAKVGDVIAKEFLPVRHWTGQFLAKTRLTARMKT